MRKKLSQQKDNRFVRFVSEPSFIQLFAWGVQLIRRI